MSRSILVTMRGALTIALACACQAIAAGDARPATSAFVPMPIPADAQLVYRTSAVFHVVGVPMSVHATTTTLWHAAQDRYEAHLHMDTAGFDQLSQGTFQGDGALAPLHYTEKKPFHDSESVAIDWPRSRVQFGNGAPEPGPESGAQDRISLQFDLARQRALWPDRFTVGSTHEVQLIGTHSVDSWTFKVIGEETVETGTGPISALRVSAQRRVRDTTESMDLWLGKTLSWLPVRIKIVDRNGAIIDSVLESATLPLQ